MTIHIVERIGYKICTKEMGDAESYLSNQPKEFIKIHANKKL
jgi:hypothetical protein